MDSQKDIENTSDSFKKVWKTLQEISENQKKTEVQMAKTEAQMAKTDAQMAKTDAQMAKTDAQMARTDKRLKALGVLTGNMANNNGYVAEDYFYNSLVDTKRLNGIKFDYIDKNWFNRKGKVKGEYDLVLVNGKYIAIIEVKHTLNVKDVERIYPEKIERFKFLFPDYAKHKMYVGVAGLSIPSEAEKKALKNGFIVLKAKGEVAEINAKNAKLF